MPVHITTLADYMEGNAPSIFSSRFLVFEINLLILNLFGYSADSLLAKINMVNIDFLALFLSQLFLYKILKKLNYPQSVSLAGITAFIYIVIFNYLLSRGHNYYNNYDFVSICFFTIFVYASIFYPTKRILLLSLVFVATFNRETSFLMPFTYLALNYKDRKSFFNFTFLLLVFLLAKLTIMYKFNLLYSPSSVASFVDLDSGFRIIRNLKVIFFLDSIGFSVVLYSIFGFLWIILLINISLNNNFNKLFYVFLLNFIIIMFVGNIDELRLWNESTILFIILFITNVVQIPKKN